MGGKTSSRTVKRDGVTPSGVFRQSSKPKKGGYDLDAFMKDLDWGGVVGGGHMLPTSKPPKKPKRIYVELPEEDNKKILKQIKDQVVARTTYSPQQTKFEIKSTEKESATDIPENFFDHIPEIEQPDVEKKPKKAGMLVVEPDGRIWMVKPKNEYGGYVQTFPKGGAEGQDLVYGAMKEVAEEAGIAALPVAFLDDEMGDFNPTRFFIGVRVGGNPLKPGTPFETATVVLEDLATAYENTVRSGGEPNVRDRKLLLAALQWMKKNGLPTVDMIKKMKKFTGEENPPTKDKKEQGKKKRDEWGEL